MDKKVIWNYNLKINNFGRDSLQDTGSPAPVNFVRLRPRMHNT